MEKSIADISALLQGGDFKSIDEANTYIQGMLARGEKIPARAATSATDRAQDLMYEAWEAGGAKGLTLAKRALEVSADCADAYDMLAEHEPDVAAALKLYEQGVAAGERALGKKAFEEDAGHFWGNIETRPYMRARAGLAQCLWQMGRRSEAIEHYREMLRLNPGDNQGHRYVLMACLLELGDNVHLDELLDQFPDDGSSAWLYGCALYEFRKSGDSKAAGATLKKALRANKHVPKFMLGHRRIPEQLPDYVGFGDENEAACCASDLLEPWRQTPGALDWLKQSL
jgi:tetratricopeptide (TPR) repeat protein